MTTGANMVAGSLEIVACLSCLCLSICPLLGHLGDLTSEQKDMVGIVIQLEYTHLMTRGSKLSKAVNMQSVKYHKS